MPTLGPRGNSGVHGLAARHSQFLEVRTNICVADSVTSREASCHVYRSSEGGFRRPEFESWFFFLLTVWPRACPLTFLSSVSSQVHCGQ